VSGETSDKPKPIISGPSQAEGIARFACRTKYEDLTPERRERLKVSVLDALACAVSALGAPPVEACRAQAEEFGGRVGSCALIGGGRSSIVYAAFYNTVLVRYVDYMDSYLAHGGLCHPSDNTAAILAASEHADQSGKDFLTALAVAYQVDSRLTEAVPFMADGFDLTTPLSFSLAAGVSRALGLEEAKTAAALGICGDFVPLLVARTTPISQWKGLSSSQLALGCVHGVSLASRGVTGPRYIFEGAHGLAQVVGAPIQIDWDNEKLDCFDRLALKSYNTVVPGQSSIFCILELLKAHAIDPSQLDRIDAAVFQDAYDFMGGGSFGPKTNVHTKEDADHSLPYLLAVALLDGDVQLPQLEPSRIDAQDAQDLLRKVTVKPDDGFTARYPDEVLSRVTVGLKDGKSYSHEVNSYPGFPTRPFTWDDIGAKFDKLVAGRADDGLAGEIKAAVRALETIEVKDLMKLLGDVKADQRA
jgi:2-methylcitrate dehydratase